MKAKTPPKMIPTEPKNAPPTKTNMKTKMQSRTI